MFAIFRTTYFHHLTMQLLTTYSFLFHQILLALSCRRLFSVSVSVQLDVSLRECRDLRAREHHLSEQVAQLQSEHAKQLELAVSQARQQETETRDREVYRKDVFHRMNCL